MKERKRFQRYIRLR